MLSDDQLLRYSRQIMLPAIDIEGQEKICNSTVLIVGVGGLGCPVSMYLASAGVGKLILVDHDDVELTNLQRQIAHRVESIGQPKVDSATATLQSLNPDCQIETHQSKVTEDNIQALVEQADVVVDCSDNFVTRFLLNRSCVVNKIPLVSGAAIRMEGQLSVYDARNDESPCYRCLYDETGQEDLSCATNGVLSPVVGVIGSLQAMEALKVLAGLKGVLVGRLLLMDGLSMEWRTMKLKKDPSCPVCAV